MTDQLDLMTELHASPNPATKARATDPATARRAALEAFPRSGKQRHRILVAVADAGQNGLTYDEVSDRTGIAGVSTSTRISELVTGGWVEQHGERETSIGGTARVWVATDKARTVLA